MQDPSSTGFKVKNETSPGLLACNWRWRARPGDFSEELAASLSAADCIYGRVKKIKSKSK